MNDKELIDANFELEQNILKCWNVIVDIRDIVNDLESGDMTQQDAISGLRAFADVYQMRFDRTFRGYEQVCQSLHELRHAVKSFEFAQDADPKNGKTGKSKKQKPVDQ
jgi:hypothetical protein